MSLKDLTFKEIHTKVMEQAKGFPDPLKLMVQILQENGDDIFKLMPIILKDDNEILCIWQSPQFIIILGCDYRYLPQRCISVSGSVTSDCTGDARSRCKEIVHKVNTIVQKMNQPESVENPLKKLIDEILEDWNSHKNV